MQDDSRIVGFIVVTENKWGGTSAFASTNVRAIDVAQLHDDPEYPGEVQTSIRCEELSIVTWTGRWGWPPGPATRVIRRVLGDSVHFHVGEMPVSLAQRLRSAVRVAWVRVQREMRIGQEGGGADDRD